MAQRRHDASAEFDDQMETSVHGTADQLRMLRAQVLAGQPAAKPAPRRPPLPMRAPAARAAGVWTSAADPGSFAELFAQPRAHSSAPLRSASPSRERASERPAAAAPTSTPPAAPAPRVPVLPPRREPTRHSTPPSCVAVETPRRAILPPARPATRRVPTAASVVSLDAHDMLPITVDEEGDFTLDALPGAAGSSDAISLESLSRVSIPRPAPMPRISLDPFQITPAPMRRATPVTAPRIPAPPRESIQSVPPVSVSLTPAPRTRTASSRPSARPTLSPRRSGALATVAAIAAGLTLGGLTAFVAQKSISPAYAATRARPLSTSSLAACAATAARIVSSTPAEPRVEAPVAQPVAAPAHPHSHHTHAAVAAVRDEDEESYDVPEPTVAAPVPVSTRVAQSDPTLPFPSTVAQQRAHNEISRRAIACAAHLERLITVHVRYEGATGEAVAIGFDDPTLHGTQAEDCLRGAVRAVSFDPFGRGTLETTLHLFVH